MRRDRGRESGKPRNTVPAAPVAAEAVLTTLKINVLTPMPAQPKNGDDGKAGLGAPGETRSGCLFNNQHARLGLDVLGIR